ncbi:hypothetical protein V6N12_024016 [Hibiscus sabdariffa]|uniref:Uncharacterized protein n=1 Tax=Hibiscus sabdariffa TaxID=183260 RepID=A0ABR2FZI8_9ROSI
MWELHKEIEDAGYRRQTAGAKPTTATCGVAKMNGKNKGSNTYLYRRERRMQEHGGETVRSRLIWTERRRYRMPEIDSAWRKGDWNVTRLLL